MNKKTGVLFAILLILAPLAFAGKVRGEVQTKSFQVSKGGTIDVSIDVGDIVITSWEKDEVSIRAEGIDEDELENLDMDQTGNTVRVAYRPEWGESFHVGFFINIPSEFNTDLSTAGGDIQIKGRLKGTLDGTTSGGDIQLGDVDGRVEMSTSGGDVIAGKVNGNVLLHTSGGDIQVTNSTGEVELTTSGGDIHVGNVGKSLVAKTSGGDVVVGDVGGQATISTAGGDIQVGRVTGSATIKTAGGDIVLKGGNGAIKAKTAGGDVMLENITGSVEASTAGGDVVAQLRPSGKGSSRLGSNGGELLLYVPANAKATIEAIIDIRGRWDPEDEDYQIVSDFKSQNYTTDKESKEIRATYVLNGGGELIQLETVNGNIQIRTLK